MRGFYENIIFLADIHRYLAFDLALIFCYRLYFQIVVKAIGFAITAPDSEADDSCSQIKKIVGLKKNYSLRPLQSDDCEMNEKRKKKFRL